MGRFGDCSVFIYKDIPLIKLFSVAGKSFSSFNINPVWFRVLALEQGNPGSNAFQLENPLGKTESATISQPDLYYRVVIWMKEEHNAPLTFLKIRVSCQVKGIFPPPPNNCNGKRQQ